jgi:hypothetical protein
VSSIPIYDGKLWSPHYVFLSDTSLADLAVLGLFGLQHYVPTKFSRQRSDYIGISSDGRWIHLIDNYGYTHLHSPDFRSRFHSLAQAMDVFSFSIGDIDMSFDIQFYRDRHLARYFRWDDPRIDGGHLGAESGSPLSFEDTIPRGSDPYDGLLRVAAGLGVQTDYSTHSIRLYAPRS